MGDNNENRDDGHKNAKADEFLRKFDASPEDVVDRKGRHYVEGQLSWEAIRELQDLGKTVAKLAASVDKVTTLAAGTEKSVAEMRGWLLDTHDVSGHPIPGVLTQMKNVGDALVTFTESAERRDKERAEAADKRSKTVETYARVFATGMVTITLSVLAQALHLVH